MVVDEEEVGVVSLYRGLKKSSVRK